MSYYPRGDRRDRGGYGGGPEDDRGRIRKLIIHVGDSSGKLFQQIKGLIGAIEDDYTKADRGDLILRMVVECAMHLPHKSSIYAAFVVGFARKYAAFGRKVVEKTIFELDTALKGHRPTQALLLLRFLAELANVSVILPDHLFDLLQHLLTLPAQLHVPANEGGDLCVFLALATLPWINSPIFTSHRGRIDTLLEQAVAHMQSREAPWKRALEPVRSAEGGSGSGSFLSAVPTPDRLETLYEALQSMAREDWKCKAILRLSESPNFAKEIGVEGGEETAEGGNAAMSGLSLSVSGADLQRRPWVPSVCCPIPSTIASVDTPMPDYDRWLVDELCWCTVSTFSGDLNECARQLLRLPLSHPQFEYILVETLLTQMLTLPYPPSLPIFYFRLFQHLALLQKSIKTPLEKAILSIARKMADFDEVAFERFADSFAFYLAPILEKLDRRQGGRGDEGASPREAAAVGGSEESDRHGWEWSQWLVVGERPPPHLLRFIKRVLERLVRLWFHGNLLQVLPPSVHPYMPPEPLPFLHSRKPSGTSHMVGDQEGQEGVEGVEGEGESADPLAFFETCEEATELRHRFPFRTERSPSVVCEEVLEYLHGLEGQPATVKMEPPREDNKGEGEEPARKKRRSDDGPEGAAVKEEQPAEGGEAVNGDNAGAMDVEAEAEAEMQHNEAAHETPHPTGPVWTHGRLVCLVMKTLLGHGSKTLTHSNRLFTLYHPVLKGMTPVAWRTYQAKKDMQQQREGEGEGGGEEPADMVPEVEVDVRVAMGFEWLLVGLVFDFYRHCPLRLELVTKQLLELGVLSPKGLLYFLFFGITLKDQHEPLPLSANPFMLHLLAVDSEPEYAAVADDPDKEIEALAAGIGRDLAGVTDAWCLSGSVWELVETTIQRCFIELEEKLDAYRIARRQNKRQITSGAMQMDSTADGGEMKDEGEATAMETEGGVAREEEQANDARKAFTGSLIDLFRCFIIAIDGAFDTDTMGMAAAENDTHSKAMWRHVMLGRLLAFGRAYAEYLIAREGPGKLLLVGPLAKLREDGWGGSLSQEEDLWDEVYRNLPVQVSGEVQQVVATVRELRV
ncbi:unnamed protein product [Vitrella brassicaformis CCMP3155]|uniref:MIF4G domain-containing protein n=2 Tax=Vitrella brassicaformis TaxID=1169539 RepID=A0A0G4GWN0_VITBC|nr:unnamed protein product [Vitrella brassicaformis CCMP3155]|eukprot:CEM35352.1 unnamed protein product [Vitrella brassicaformis CCMP3155]